MTGSGTPGTGHGTLRGLNKCSGELRERIARINILGPRRLGRIHHLCSRGEACNHALSSKDDESVRDLSTHNACIRLPRLDEAEILECPILSLDQASLHTAERAVLDGKEMTLTECKGIKSGFL